MPVRSALVFSDVHLGWTVCTRHHASWLGRLDAAADDAELVLLNGDVIDGYRRAPGAAARELVHEFVELVARWRREGRHVVYVEGNHDAALDAAFPLRPDRWQLDFETDAGHRVRALHGHRFAPGASTWERYDRLGRRVLAIENAVYARRPALQALYRLGPGWLVSAAGFVECALGRRQLPRRLDALAGDVDVLLHGHIHYGPGRGAVGRVETWRTGSWVSPGHLGTADRMLRYRDRRFERIGWAGGRWRAFDDGR
ncbi:MAG: metallophosphoesterase [Thermodesulfobacteriota bacterium]